MFKKTKIVATLGPATDDKKTIEKMIKVGMNVARLNFSHGSHDEHLGKMNLVVEAAEKFNKPVAILQDLCGPKIRIGDFYKDSIRLKKGKSFILTTKKCVGDENRVSVSYKNLAKEVKKGAIIMLNDGKNRLEVKKVSGNDIYCKIIAGGEIRGRRGVNIPGAYLKISALTAKDKKDLKFGVINKVDFMAISFVRTARDVLRLKDILDKEKADIKIIAKIETPEAIENIDEIIKVSDGIMVARGDLAVEIPAEEVPVLQKIIIEKCNCAGKPVITATQMLESMTRNPVPTRAEVNDVANAILDGSDAVMLSEESAVGDYPVKAVEMMACIALHTEKNLNYEEELSQWQFAPKEIADSISYAVVNVAHNIEASVIVALTESSFTARMISRYKPWQTIIALTPNKKTFRKLALSFGCNPELIGRFGNIEDIVEAARKLVVKNKLAKKGDKIVITAGIPFGKAGTTNLLLARKI